MRQPSNSPPLLSQLPIAEDEGSGRPASGRRRLPQGWRLRDDEAPYLSAVVLTLIAFAIRYVLDPVLEDRSPMLLFTAAVVMAAGRYGTGPGLLSMVLSLIAGSLVFVAPGFPPA